MFELHPVAAAKSANEPIKRRFMLMMNATVRCGALLVLVVIGAASCVN
jgi:hypothetical protein